MDHSQRPDQVVFTNHARCRDCYRCLRACPLKAIKLEDGQASVVGDLCVSCGTCLRACPQGAKSLRPDAARVRRMLSEGPVALSVAPTFAALLPPPLQRRLASALRRLGFSYVAETSVGAWHVAQATAEEALDGPSINAACPAVAGWIERYRPEAAPWLSTIVSPMVAHARALKADRPQRPVVFVGPCAAKKAEADVEPSVDAALTFEALWGWLDEAGIDLSACEESDFDEEPGPNARLYPLPGGLAHAAAKLDHDPFGAQVISLSGFDALRGALDDLLARPRPVLIEALFCEGGCVDGPAIGRDSSLLERRLNLIDYARAREEGEAPAPLADLRGRVQAEPLPLPALTDEDIRRGLAEMGKAKAEDQLDCGACGYETCRDKVVGVLRGMAEAEMCLPLMRRRAEQRTDIIIESSPNGILILDERLEILHMNPAFRAAFLCSDAVLGKRVSYLMDPEPFERLASGEETVIESTLRLPSYGLVCRQLLYALPQARQYVGVFVNVTQSQAREAELESLRSETVRQARELLEHQLAAAQEMARFLGESTARGEALVNNLLKIAAADEAPEPKERWLWPTRT